MRQIVLDIETTGLEVERDHRIVEIGCVEMVSRRLTGNDFHHYLDPERAIDRVAQEVQGISNADLIGKPRFAEIANTLRDYLAGAELLIHIASFDVSFLDAEFARIGEWKGLAAICTITDTLALARKLHPGQRTDLDSLCRRYEVDNSQRRFLGALRDARLLVQVYLAMTGGQEPL